MLDITWIITLYLGEFNFKLH